MSSTYSEETLCSLDIVFSLGSDAKLARGPQRDVDESNIPTIQARGRAGEGGGSDGEAGLGAVDSGGSGGEERGGRRAVGGSPRRSLSSEETLSVSSLVIIFRCFDLRYHTCARTAMNEEPRFPRAAKTSMRWKAVGSVPVPEMRCVDFSLCWLRQNGGSK